jgi:hypothetical protein
MDVADVADVADRADRAGEAERRAPGSGQNHELSETGFQVTEEADTLKNGPYQRSRERAEERDNGRCRSGEER